ncbi:MULTISPECIES: YcnI family protein [unclassified Curtobacterium]|uniref:YcnI family copper-binding membrane protein n=1 Tax=unclassified Curtobacterium TaxID=257496 RepID=UPI000824ED62|nr:MULTISPECIES: YcnI family protein [unclassified Curtobacterium]WIA97843.1 YcnI family protein [Curtobacterium sp. MCBA15_004]
MTKRLALVGTATLGVTAAIVLGTAGAASAHVEADATSTAANSYTTATFSVPHGCDGSPTTKLEFSVPKSVIEVTPTVNPNWTITKTTEPYTSSSSSSSSDEEAAPAERVTSVTYTAKTPLPADERDTFALSFSLPDGKPGDRVSFPVVQTCEQGSTDWDQQQTGKEEPEHPAPSIVLTAASSSTGDDDATTATASTASATTGGPDLVGRFLGLGGLVVGAVGLVVAVAATRRRDAGARNTTK